jgi:hypothetical protein
VSLNCKNCGANIDAERGSCPYCGSSNSKALSVPNSDDPRTTTVDAIKSFVDPTSNYRSSENSVKPNFSDGAGSSSGADKIWIGIGIAILVLLFLSFF